MLPFAWCGHETWVCHTEGK